MRGYVPISEAAMRAKLQAQMGFTQVHVPGTHELVFERAVNERYTVRIFTTIVGGWTRETGEDAIRVMIFDKQHDNPAKVERRVHRTENALTNMHERAREMYRWVQKRSCTACGSIFVERKGPRGKFLGCSGYPVCKQTRQCDPA